MTTYTQVTGDHGEIRVDVSVLSEGVVCDFYIRSTSVVAVPSLAYSWQLDSGTVNLETFNFLATTTWQYMRSVSAGSAASVKLHLPASGTAQLGGPTDLVVDLTTATALPPSTPNGTQSGNTWTLPTGDHGELRVDDLTDTPAGTCDLYIRSTSVVAIPSLGWGYALNGATPDLRQFNFLSTTLWQHLGLVYVGHASRITLHLTATGTPQLGGPTDLVVDLTGGSSSAYIMVDGAWVRATSYVNVAGTWKPADVFVRSNGDWAKVI